MRRRFWTIVSRFIDGILNKGINSITLITPMMIKAILALICDTYITTAATPAVLATLHCPPLMKEGMACVDQTLKLYLQVYACSHE